MFQSTPPSREATGISTNATRLYEFQSTPPSREATLSPSRVMFSRSRFNPRPPHGRRRGGTRELMAYVAFQSTPPSREATHRTDQTLRPPAFQSTPPSREATWYIHQCRPTIRVSIHAPLTGGDEVHFHNLVTPTTVSIHAPLTGGDPDRHTTPFDITRFNPRPPHGRRQDHQTHRHRGISVSIHAPLTGGDPIVILPPSI